MELRLIVPAETEDSNTEILNGTFWRVSEPIDISKQNIPKYHCISYVWGSGRMQDGALFQIGPRLMSDQTKPALEAAIVAHEAASQRAGETPARAFWIDAVCVPESEGPQRQATLESMGFIYSAATSVIVILQQMTWEVIRTACAKNSPDALSENQMKLLNRDPWIESVWTYQELVNNDRILFTSMHNKEKDCFVPISQFFNCIGFSLQRWKKHIKHELDATGTFANLVALEDTFADWMISNGYTERSALTVLSSMAPRRCDPEYPKNRLLAALGAITKDVSWGTPAETMFELVGKVIQTCEKKNDYSIIYMADEREDRPGLRWRPKTEDSRTEEPRVENPRVDESQAEQGIAKESPAKGFRPVHLCPILAWHCFGNPLGSTQQAHSTPEGLWLDNMIQLRTSATVTREAHEKLVGWLSGFNGWRQDGAILLPTGLYSAFVQIGFSGSDEPYVCETGLFFPQRPLSGKEGIKFFAAASISWAFGAPGLASWEHGSATMYSAGVFAGVVEKERAEPLLML